MHSKNKRRCGWPEGLGGRPVGNGVRVVREVRILPPSQVNVRTGLYFVLGVLLKVFKERSSGILLALKKQQPGCCVEIECMVWVRGE